MIYDLVVIGAGPGGYPAAVFAAQSGLKVAVVEKEHLGGVCLNWGCIPTKSLLKASEHINNIRHANEWGIDVTLNNIDVAKMVAQSRDTVKKLTSGIEHLFKSNKVEVINGTARLKKDGEIVILDVEGNEVKARNIIIATGSKARTLPGMPESEHVLDIRRAMTPKEIPASIAIIGAGAIGIEFASFYNALGAKVTVFEMADMILPGVDVEIAKLMKKEMEKAGIKFHLKTQIEKIEGSTCRVDQPIVQDFQSAGGATELVDKQALTHHSHAQHEGSARSFASWAGSRAHSTIEHDVTQSSSEVTCRLGLKTNLDLKYADTTCQVDKMLVAVGVIPNVADFNQLELEKGYIKTNETHNVFINGKVIPNIFAVGDCTKGPWLAHKATAEGMRAVKAILGQKLLALSAVPMCIYTTPQIASIGLTQEQCKQEHANRKIKIVYGHFLANGKALAIKEAIGFIKIITDEESGEILGAHMIGPEVTELISTIALGMKLEALPQDFIETIMPHPTLSEIVYETMLEV